MRQIKTDHTIFISFLQATPITVDFATQIACSKFKPRVF